MNCSSSAGEKLKRERINYIDELRGLLMILVILYHLLYDLALIFRYHDAAQLLRNVQPWQPVLPLGFILISGISFQLGSKNLLRGFKLLAVALAMTAVTALVMPSQIIIFGIIALLAVSIIICSLTDKFIEKIPTAAGLLVCAVLFAATYNVQWHSVGVGAFSFELPEWLFRTDLTMMFGLRTRGFYSSDYTPMLPWFFAFVFGVFLGRYVKNSPEFLCRKHIPPLAFIGRHTLIIYLLHQPIIVGALYLINGMKL